MEPETKDVKMHVSFTLVRKVVGISMISTTSDGVLLRNTTVPKCGIAFTDSNTSYTTHAALKLSLTYVYSLYSDIIK